MILVTSTQTCFVSVGHGHKLLGKGLPRKSVIGTSICADCNSFKKDYDTFYFLNICKLKTQCLL